ncbi:secreted RxLR effector protein 161-like [Hibiscus syriacus]|uniref:secreted RxLR effector protein 161-like n=1 Tax=Hibiscus syriacus TaxID=106335 RepID=UPI001922C5BE|nr:secreted RxLR effector protein 161-like [Hibiscus syriacus]
MHAPCEKHLGTVKRVLQYLNKTLDYGLFISEEAYSQRLVAFVDADWGGSMDDRRFISGNCVYLGDNLVMWSSKKKKIVLKSTTEAEYRCLADVASDVTWLSALLDDMGIELLEASAIWSDKPVADGLTKDYFRMFRQRLGAVSLEEVESERSEEHVEYSQES